MNQQNLYSRIPKVDDLLRNTQIAHILETYPKSAVTDCIRESLDVLRQKIREGAVKDEESEDLTENAVALDIELRLKKLFGYHLKRVINGTGVVLHTNLGRSLAASELLENLGEIAGRYSNLEFNLETGTRGSRYSHVEDIICRLVGAEAAMVVNNNAAAVLLALSTLASQKEVVVSRGQLVEIGGSFRIPDVMRQSGATLVEVGTTNKTHLRDYRNAITEETALLMKVHTSNFRVLGFTQEVSIEEMSDLGREFGIPVLDDLGSGSLVDLSAFGLTKEPTVAESLRAGADVITFSGDKLLGGPQAGIIAGRKTLIDAMRKNQLTRALRVDKMTLALLEGTLRLYLDEDRAVKAVPTIRMLIATDDEMKVKAEHLYNLLNREPLEGQAEIIPGFSEVGGGSLPLEQLPTHLVAITPKLISAAETVRRLRGLHTPVVCRVQEDRLLFDPRTIFDDELEMLAESIRSVLA